MERICQQRQCCAGGFAAEDYLASTIEFEIDSGKNNEGCHVFLHFGNV